MSNITVIGAGRVGLTTAACFAELGHKITVIEIDADKIAALKNGIMPVNEPGLPEIWERLFGSGQIALTESYVEGLLGADFAFIAVGTPATSNGKPDLKWVRMVSKNIAESASGPLVVVIKSTVPIGTSEVVSRIIAHNNQAGYNISVVSNPEFLREGVALLDSMNPDRIVIGSPSLEVTERVAELTSTIDSSVVKCDNRTAEMAKYVDNAYLATRISFMNEISLLCEEYGVDVVKIEDIMRLNKQFGGGYLHAGLGWGGSCLPKDIKALIHMAKTKNIPARLLRAVQQINQQQVYLVVRKLYWLLGSLEGKTVGILGVAFKPNSDNIREARSLIIMSLLEDQGCRIKAYDPDKGAVQSAAKYKMDVQYCDDAHEVARGSDALVLVTEWDEFKDLDMAAMAASMNHPILVDGRNIYDPDEMIRAGFLYEGIGRCSQRSHETRFSVIQ